MAQKKLTKETLRAKSKLKIKETEEGSLLKVQTSSDIEVKAVPQNTIWNLPFRIVWKLIPWVPLLMWYWYNSARRVTGFSDSDELVMSAVLGGLSHPPGHKLFTIILGAWIKIIPGDNNILDASMLAGLMQVGALLLIYSAAMNFLGSGKSALKWIIGLWGVTSIWWFNGVVPNTWAFDSLLSSLILYLGSLTFIGKGWKRSAVLLFVWGFSIAHNVVMLIWAPWVLWIVWNEVKGEKKWLLLGMFLLGWISVFITLWPVSKSIPASWNVPRNLGEVLAYTSWPLGIRNVGSFIESIVIVTQWVWNETRGIGLIMVIVGLWQLIKKDSTLGYICLSSILLGTWGVAVYLIQPDKSLGETAYFWGALQIVQLTAPAIVMMVFASTYAIAHFKFDAKFKEMFLVLVIGLLAAKQITDISPYMDVAKANLMDELTKQVLTDLPQYAVLVAGDDLLGSILYQQQVNQIRTDVVVMPVTWQRRYEWTKNNVDYLGWEFPEAPQQAANIVSWNLFRGRRVFTFALEPKMLERIGIDGNPFYAAPQGYSIELTYKPQLPPEGTYSMTEPLSRIKNPGKTSFYDQGLLSFFSIQHTMYGYIHWKLGFHEPAMSHWYLAQGLARFPETKDLIGKLKDQPVKPALYKSIPQPYTWWMDQSIQSANNQNWFEAYFQAERATLLAPTDQKARELMWEVARKSNTADAEIHYQILSAYEEDQVDNGLGL